MRSSDCPRTSRDARCVGVGFDRDRLREAGIEEAGALAAVTNGDNSNILVARVARETFGIERVVARIYDPRRAAIYERLGIPTIATVQWATERVLRRILPDAAGGRVDRPERQGVRWSSAPVPGGWAGRLLGDLDVEGIARSRRPSPGSAWPPCLDPTPWPRRATSCTWRSPATASTSSTTPRSDPGGAALMRVVIAGGGNVGTFIADELAEGGPRGRDRRDRPRTGRGRSGPR